MPNERLAEIYDAVVEAARKIVAEKGITYAELDAAGAYLEQMAQTKGQLVDFINLACYTAAADLQAEREINPNALVIGPRWKEGAPVKSDGVLYEADRPQVPLLKVSGRVFDPDTGKGIEGAQVDFWGCRQDGEYDLTGYDQRGKVVTGADGAYEFTTLEPGIYKTHDGDEVDALMQKMGRTTHRSRHLHLKVWVDGKDVLTSQFYDPASPYLDTDMLHASVRPELIADWKEVEPDNGRKQLQATYDIPVRVTA